MARSTTVPALLTSVLFASTVFVAAPAAAEPAQRAVSQCRAEMLSQFPAGAVRTYRVAEIGGNSRRTRVTINVTADRQYRFECAAGPDGRVLAASFDPPRSDAQLAAGQ